MCCHGNMGSESDRGRSHLLWWLCWGPQVQCCCPLLDSYKSACLLSRAFTVSIFYIQGITNKGINKLVFGFVILIISAICFIHSHILSPLRFLVPSKLLVYEGRAGPWAEASGFVCLLLLGSLGGIRVLEKRKLRFSGCCITAAVGFVCLVQLLPS